MVDRAADHGSKTFKVAPDVAWVESPWLLPVILGIHIVLWTAYANLAQSAGAVHHDMTEAWTWGQNFALGYYKHPPFYAWIVGAWFHVFPRTDFWFYLLSTINSGLGLAGVWFLAGRLVGPTERLVSVLLVSLAPYHNIMAINFNANAILLSLWPWTTYAFVRAVQTGRTLDGVLFGVLAAAALLSKYFSALLLAGCLFASLLHPRARAIYRSPAPYVALVVCVVLLLPHAWWAVSNQLQTIDYALNKVNKSAPSYGLTVTKTLATAVASLGLLGLGVLALGVGGGRTPSGWRTLGGWLSTAWRRARGEGAWIAVLAWTPYVLTLLAGFLASVKVSTNFMIPVLYMAPLSLLALASAQISPQRLRLIRRWALGYPLVALLVAPVIAFVLFKGEIDLAVEPRRELAERATQEWRTAFGLPLRLVAGTQAYGTGMAFYSADSPAEFTRLNHSQAPWVTPARVRAEGLLVACRNIDADCVEKSQGLMTPQSKRLSIALTRTFWGMTTRPLGFEVFMIPPGDITAVREPMLHRN